jgi:hypothetical protein
VASSGCSGARATKAAMSAVTEQPAAVTSVSIGTPLRTSTTLLPSVTCTATRRRIVSSQMTRQSVRHSPHQTFRLITHQVAATLFPAITESVALTRDNPSAHWCHRSIPLRCSSCSYGLPSQQQPALHRNHTAGPPLEIPRGKLCRHPCCRPADNSPHARLQGSSWHGLHAHMHAIHTLCLPATLMLPG